MTTKGGPGNQNTIKSPPLVVSADGTTTLLGSGMARFNLSTGQKYIQLTADATLANGTGRGIVFYDDGDNPVAVIEMFPQTYGVNPILNFYNGSFGGGDNFLTATLDTFQVKFGPQYNVTEVTTATYSPTVKETILSVTRTGAGACTINLPSAASRDGLFFIVKDEGLNALVNNITVDPAGAETIDGAATFAMNLNGQSIQIYARNGAWWIY